MMNHLFHIPRHGGTVLLAGIQDILSRIPGQKSHPHLIPRDPRTIVNALNLDPVTIRYIACVECHALRKLSEVPIKQANGSVTLCNERVPEASLPCGAPLFTEQINNKGDVCWKPQRTVLLQCLKNWIGRLLSRPGIEDILTSYPYGVMNDANQSEVMSDIWASPTISKLRGRDGKPFFNYDKDDEEIRFLFTFAGDGYNPFQNKTAKQNIRSMGFWIVLLNFPPDQRFQFNNIFYLGSLPPKTPPAERYQPILSLVCKMMQEFWEPGVFFTKTHKYTNGHPARGMLAPFTSDMSGIRAILGFSSPTSTKFCMDCLVTLHDIENFEIKTWGTRDFEADKKHAYEWKNARNVQEQKILLDKHGVRFTPFWELAYWARIYYVLVEPMHALLLGLIHHHCRKFLLIDEEHNGGDGSGPRMERPTYSNWGTLQNALRELLDVFKTNLRDEKAVRLIQKHPSVTYRNLWYLCSAFHLRVAGNLKERHLFVRRIMQMASSLVSWACIITLTIAKMRSLHQPDLEELQVPEVEEPVLFTSVFQEAEQRLHEKSRTKEPNFSDERIRDCVELLRQIYRRKFASMKVSKNVYVNLCSILTFHSRRIRILLRKCTLHSRRTQPYVSCCARCASG